MDRNEMDKILNEKVESGKKISPVLPEGVKNYLIDIDGTITEDVPNEEPERMEILHEFKGVDHVVKWYDGTQNCIGALRKIRPNIFTKGGDRSSRDRIPEADVCDEVGCKIMFGVGGKEKAQSSSWLTSKQKV